MCYLASPHAKGLAEALSDAKKTSQLLQARRSPPCSPPVRATYRMQSQHQHAVTWFTTRKPTLPCVLPAKSQALSLTGPAPLSASPPSPPARLAIFVSGGGSNMKAIHAAILDGRINAAIAVVVSDVPDCGGMSYAREQGISTLIYPTPKKETHSGLTVDELVSALTGSKQCDYVILAGYLKLVPAELVHAFPRAMLNIHPGLLPAFGGKGMYGSRVHEAVIASGTRVSGPTVHFVDEEFDRGPILAQRAVPVYPTDSPLQLAARVLKQEHQLYPEAVAALVDGRITWRADGIPIIWQAQ